MKISELLNNANVNQYIIGGIFSNPVFTNNNKILYLSVSKMQKTNVDLKIKITTK